MSEQNVKETIEAKEYHQWLREQISQDENIKFENIHSVVITASNSLEGDVKLIVRTILRDEDGKAFADASGTDVATEDHTITMKYLP